MEERTIEAAAAARVSVDKQATQDPPILAVRNLEVVYNDVALVLRGVSLSVAPKSVVALLGANGAGKTTLLRSVTGLLPIHRGKITKGTVEFDGQAVNTNRASS